MVIRSTWGTKAGGIRSLSLFEPLPLCCFPRVEAASSSPFCDLVCPLGYSTGLNSRKKHTMATQAGNTGDDITQVREPSHAPAPASGNPTREKAAEFLASHAADQSSFTWEEEKEVVKRIDRRVLVLILGAYFFQQLDKSSLR